MYGLTAKVHDWIVGHGTSTLSGLTLADLLLGQPANLLELVNGRFGVEIKLRKTTSYDFT